MTASAMLTTANGKAVSQPKSNRPVANALATAQPAITIGHCARGRIIKSAMSRDEATHRYATPPSNRLARSSMMP